MKHWDNYRVKRWPVFSLWYGKLVYRFNPQYKEGERWVPYETKDGKPRLYRTRMEAEQWIEVQVYAERKRNEENQDM